MSATQLSMFPEPQEKRQKQPRATSVPQRVRAGDLWQLGRHRLLCGDSTHAEDVARLMDGKRARMIVTSPPYSDQRAYTIGAFDWTSLMVGAFARMLEVLAPDGQILINLGLSHKKRAVDMYWQPWLDQCAAIGWPLFGWYVWDKGAALPGDRNGRYGPAFEFVFHFCQRGRRPNKIIKTRQYKGSDKRTFRYPDGSLKPSNSPGKYGQSHKIPDSVLRIKREYVHGIHTANHPAVFPSALPDFLMRSWSDAGDAIYEPFCGAGTTLIAAETCGRICYGMEIEPTYCDVVIARYEQETGQRAALLSRLEATA